VTPRSQAIGDKGAKGAKGSAGTMTTWLKVRGNAFKGAVSSGTDSEIDFSVEGQRKR
jgi:hypothetical protein